MRLRRVLFSLSATWLLPLLALITFSLGLSGWLDHGYDLNEAAYRTACLFDLGNGYYGSEPGSTDWRFAVGRWTALATLFGAALFALAALLRERVALAVARFVRQEVVVIGSNGLAVRAFGMAFAAKQSVLWLGASRLGAESARSIALPWPPEDRARTVADHAGDAGHVLVAVDDDAEALVLGRAARRAAPRALITLLMEDTQLAMAAAAALDEPNTRVLSVASVAARMLAIDHPPFLIAKDLGHPRIHAVIVGFGQTGQAVARDLIVNCRTTYLGRPRITVIDPQARALEGVMRVQAPELDACADIHFIAGRIGSEAIEPDAEGLAEAIAVGGPVTCAYVCQHVDADAWASAAMLQALLRNADLNQPPIFVRLRGTATIWNPTVDEQGLNALIPFGDLDGVLFACEFLSNAPDRAARAFSEAYRASLTPTERDDPSNRAVRPWPQLPETFRQANRDAVAHMPAKMASAGIDPKFWRGMDGAPTPDPASRLFSNDAECERLAELEHERWNAQRRMDGWRWADLPRKDEARRLHPSLVPYEALSDEVKEFDRVYIRQTQKTCWKLAGE